MAGTGSEAEGGDPDPRRQGAACGLTRTGQSSACFLFFSFFFLWSSFLNFFFPQGEGVLDGAVVLESGKLGSDFAAEGTQAHTEGK